MDEATFHGSALTLSWAGGVSGDSPAKVASIVERRTLYGRARDARTRLLAGETNEGDATPKDLETCNRAGSERWPSPETSMPPTTPDGHLNSTRSPTPH